MNKGIDPVLKGSFRAAFEKVGASWYGSKGGCDIIRISLGKHKLNQQIEIGKIGNWMVEGRNLDSNKSYAEKRDSRAKVVTVFLIINYFEKKILRESFTGIILT